MAVLRFTSPLEADNAATRSNDGRVHACGALWIGTMGRNAENGAGAIYHFGGGEFRRLYAGISIPNAICFSPDGATAYFTDTRKAILYRVAIDPTNALPTGDPAPLFDHRGGVGGLDGAVVDAEGLIWNARWGGSCIDAYTPEGQRVRTIRVPARQPSCPVFVGANFDRLLVTTAWQGMDEQARAADPHHGQTFILDVGARGRPEPRVRLGRHDGPLASSEVGHETCRTATCDRSSVSVGRHGDRRCAGITGANSKPRPRGD